MTRSTGRRRRRRRRRQNASKDLQNVWEKTKWEERVFVLPWLPWLTFKIHMKVREEKEEREEEGAGEGEEERMLQYAL